MKSIKNIFFITLLVFSFVLISAGAKDVSSLVQERTSQKTKFLKQLKIAKKSLQTHFIISDEEKLQAVAEIEERICEFDDNEKLLLNLAKLKKNIEVASPYLDKIKKIKSIAKDLKVNDDSFDGFLSSCALDLNKVLSRIVREDVTRVELNDGAFSFLLKNNYLLIAQINKFESIPLKLQPYGQLKIYSGIILGSATSLALLYTFATTANNPQKRRAAWKGIKFLFRASETGVLILPKGCVGVYKYICKPVWVNVIKNKTVRNPVVFFSAGFGAGCYVTYKLGEKLKKLVAPIVKLA